ncbi:hypothetical protein [Kitasatospora kifunensis]|uniref:Uncharacterized protein n=1 Tax=Kitasatospora kifunensis TaxID=58351 RepID=A0A7W7VV68_KITKI|nr:hypothetical protein [Kitasatospora kifunensis]MBB4924072.1 hypothetical protein [Kitasatospora kifunensis]
MSQRRSYPNSGDFNLDDLFRPEPAPGQQPPMPPQGAPQSVPPAVTQAGQGGPEYLGPGASWGDAPTAYVPEVAPEAAGETQYLPPYPTSDPMAGGAGVPGQAGPQGQPSYGGQQSFRSPSQPPFPSQPSYGGQQTFGGQQAFGGPPPPAGQPTYGGQQSFNPTAAYQTPNEQTTRLGRASLPPAGSGGGARMSRKAVIGGVVAVCAVGAILVGVLSSGGDDTKPKDKAKAKHTAAQSTDPSTQPSGSASSSGSSSALSADAQAQAQALSSLLGNANASRQAVIGAVGAVKKCDNPAAAQTALTQASAQRKELMTKLAALKVDKLPTGKQLVDQLNQAWQASANADDAYAAWAGDFAQSCDPTKVGSDANLQSGDQASGTATTAKGQASGTWNAIAQQAGLPSLSPAQL